MGSVRLSRSVLLFISSPNIQFKFVIQRDHSTNLPFAIRFTAVSCQSHAGCSICKQLGSVLLHTCKFKLKKV